MGQVTRRGLLVGMGSGLLAGAWPEPAAASVVRSLSLPALVRSSRRIVVLTALTSSCHYQELGRRRRIVTDTRVRVEDAIAKSEGIGRELVVRTLGGQLGDLGEHVRGQPLLSPAEPCVAFLLEAPDGLHYLSGMAQGHYPLGGRAARTLARSPDLPPMLGYDGSAVQALVGRRLDDAAVRIRELSKSP
jgi:hypothetical protein